MTRRPPVIPRSTLLPFHDPAFTWETFESFFCDFLAGKPQLDSPDGKKREVHSARPYGRKGDSQHGIDIKATMEGGDIWAFQCKHYKTWGPAQTREAIKKCHYTEASRKFLLVTREVSEECYNIIAMHPDWELWDSRKISCEFLNRLALTEAARLLYLHFGPGWSEALLDLPGHSPLIGAEANFKRFLEERRSFHHRLALVGRENWITRLDDFVKDDYAKVFLLIGRGGIGKSRLLYEWSRGKTDQHRAFASRHPSYTLRFLSDAPKDDYGPDLDGSSKPLVLVLDDAHRLDEVRRSLFAALPQRQNIKLVLALRPGPTARVRQELVDAGYDVSHIVEPTLPLERLNAQEAQQLAERALGPELARLHGRRLARFSKESPLLAVLAAELLKRGGLRPSEFDDSNEFHELVYRRLLREAEPIYADFGKQPSLDFLRLIALLAPVSNNMEFRKAVASFIDVPPHRVADMIQAIDNTGLLLSTRAGLRITPDLLSDHLVYTACYDEDGGDKAFAQNVLAHFSPDQFPKVLEHLAEAEWHAVGKNKNADSVVKPVWTWFVGHFENSNFIERNELLKQWSHIAHLQPERTLELANLALQLNSAPKPENLFFYGHEFNSHQYVIDALPSIIKPLAETHPEQVKACLDLLWDLGREKPPTRLSSNQGHPIATIAAIASFQPWKSLEIQYNVLDWLDTKFSDDAWLTCKNKPDWLLSILLEHFFATGMTETWITGRTIHTRPHLLPLQNTEPVRKRVLELCRKLLARRSVLLALAIIPVLEKAIEPARIPMSWESVPAEFAEKWLTERLKALEVLAEIVREFPDAVVHYSVRRVLRKHLEFPDTEEFRKNCQQVYSKVPESLELDVLRASLGSYYAEFRKPSNAGKPHGGEDEAKRLWDEFLNTTSAAILKKAKTSPAVLRYLEDLGKQLQSLGFHPNFRPLLFAVSHTQPDVALNLAEELIKADEHPLALYLDTLILPATTHDLDRRLSLCEQAISSDRELIVAGAIGCLAWWRTEGTLPERGWQMALSAAENATSLVAQALVQFVWRNNKAASIKDWNLLAMLPVKANENALATSILASSVDLINAKIPQPEPNIIAQLFRNIEPIDSIDHGEIQDRLSQLAQCFPEQVFMFLWRWLQRHKEDKAKFSGLPFDIDTIRFPRPLNDTASGEVIQEMEARLLATGDLDHNEETLLRMALLNTDKTKSEESLIALLERTATREQLEHLTNFVLSSQNTPMALAFPNFTRKLLIQANRFGKEAHQRVFNCLANLPGGSGSNGAEPDSQWKQLLKCAEQLAHSYAADPELGALYATAVQRELSRMESMRNDHIRDMALLEEE